MKKIILILSIAVTGYISSANAAENMPPEASDTRHDDVDSYALYEKLMHLYEKVINQETTLDEAAPQLIEWLKIQDQRQRTAIDQGLDQIMFCNGTLENGPYFNYANGGLITISPDSPEIYTKEDVYSNPYGEAYESFKDILAVWEHLYLSVYGETYTLGAIETIEALVDGRLVLKETDRDVLLRTFFFSGYAVEDAAYENSKRLSDHCDDSPKATPIRHVLGQIREGKTSLKRVDSWLAYLIKQREREYVAYMEKAVNISEICGHSSSRIYEYSSHDSDLTKKNKALLYSNPDEYDSYDWANMLSQYAKPTEMMKTVISDLVSVQFPKSQEFGMTVLYELLNEANINQGSAENLIERNQNCNNKPKKP